MPTPTLRDRYSKRTEELLALSVAARPEDPGPVVARVLGAAGDLLRRRSALTPDLAPVERALLGLPDRALSSWREGVGVGELTARLKGAVAFAVDAALPDEDGDVAALSTWAMQGLQARDELESAAVALEWLGARARPHAAALAAGLRSDLERVDRGCRPAVAGLTPLNPLRRPEAALLDERERGRAWWFSARCGVEDDQLVPVLGGQRPGRLSPEDRRASEVVADSRSLPVSSAALLRLDLGLATPAEERAVRRRAEADPELALALAAMEAGEAAIEALEHPAREAVSAPPARTAPAPDATHEGPDFKVLVFRLPRVVRVVVQPRQPDRLTAAALHRAGGGDQGLQGTPGPGGLEFELPRGGEGAVRLVVVMKGGGTTGLDLALE